MSLSVALIDESEITQKMLSHCVYYYTSEVLRFDNLESLQAHFSTTRPDIIFVDWQVQDKGQPLIYSIIKQLDMIPIVLLYRHNFSDQEGDGISYKIKKPLDPNQIRDMIVKLVPKVKDSLLHSFLKFPKNRESFQTPQKSQTSRDNPESMVTKPDIGRENTKGMVSMPKTSRDNPESTVTKTETSIGYLDSMVTKTETSIECPEETITKLKKENINIDENTQNNFAPMAIKSFFPDSDNSSNNQRFEMKESDILRVVNQYKDTLEFQKLVENILSESLKVEFKNFIEEKMPLIAKEIIEKEIKKIIED